MAIGAGTLLSPEQVQRAIDAGAQFGVSPGLNEAVLKAAQERNLPFFPGVMTPTEVDRALNLGWKHLKFFPAEPAGGVAMLKALAGPFAHTGVKFIPTGGINAAKLPDYLAMPQVAAVGGSWMAERKLVAEKAWSKITALTAEAMKVIAQAKAVGARAACPRIGLWRNEHADEPSALRSIPNRHLQRRSRRSAKRRT